ncbi:MAG: hypothetical protein ACYS7Y_11850 [Planctomycetota bacterium]|jgi:hypothetical protein
MCEKPLDCPLCGKPVGYRPKGCEKDDVVKMYHMSCLMESTKHLREKK